MALPPAIARLLHSKWTSAAPVEGWRHFEVRELRTSADGWQVLLVASCDAARQVQVTARALQRREGWVPGWVPLRQL